MRMSIKSVLTGIVAVGLTIGANASATSLIVPGMAGIAQNPKLSAQFTNSYGMLTNTGAAATYCISLPVSEEGTHSITAFVSAPSVSDPISCSVEANAPNPAVDECGGSATQSYYGAGTGLTFSQTTNFTNNDDGTLGYDLYLCCDMGTGSTIGSVTWTQ